MAKREGSSTSGTRPKSKAAKEGREAKIIAEHGVEDECDQLRCEFRALKKEQAKLNRKISEKERRLKDEELEEQLRPLRRETQQVQRNLRQKRKRLKELCDAIEVENTYQRLDKLPPEVWEKILDHLEDADLFPLALSSRYFRQKQKELVARARQSGPGSGGTRLALKTNLKRKLKEGTPAYVDALNGLDRHRWLREQHQRQRCHLDLSDLPSDETASAEYLRFCFHEKVFVPVHKYYRHKRVEEKAKCIRQLAAFHGHLPLLQELIKPLNELPYYITEAASESSFSQSLPLLLCFGF